MRAVSQAQCRQRPPHLAVDQAGKLAYRVQHVVTPRQLTGVCSDRPQQCLAAPLGVAAGRAAELADTEYVKLPNRAGSVRLSLVA